MHVVTKLFYIGQMLSYLCPQLRLSLRLCLRSTPLPKAAGTAPTSPRPPSPPSSPVAVRAAMSATISPAVASLRFLIQPPCLRLVERREPEDARSVTSPKERKECPILDGAPVSLDIMMDMSTK